ncbi:hypothetical protein [Rubellimicrobium rubrum]
MALSHAWRRTILRHILGCSGRRVLPSASYLVVV